MKHFLTETVSINPFLSSIKKLHRAARLDGIPLLFMRLIMSLEECVVHDDCPDFCGNPSSTFHKRDILDSFVKLFFVLH